jgi:hypothetical protein
LRELTWNGSAEEFSPALKTDLDSQYSRLFAVLDEAFSTAVKTDLDSQDYKRFAVLDNVDRIDSECERKI